MLTKQIESAQKKVEEQNFLIRKRVLEYDDVMNQQREIIYEYRDRILEGEDMSRDRARADRRRDRAARRRVPGGRLPSRTGTSTALFTQLEQIYPSRAIEARGPRPEHADRDALIEELSEDVVKAYDEREEELGEELMRALERYILLQIIDERWREHLHDMDYLREGIHLRGFAQIEPLVAYKNEGFEMFTGLINRSGRSSRASSSTSRSRSRARTATADGAARAGARPAARASAPRRLQLPRRRPRRASRAPSRQRPRGGRAGGHRRGRRRDAGERSRAVAGQSSSACSTRRADRAQRPVLVRIRQEVQEVPRCA